MARMLPNWLDAFIAYTDHMEAPKLLRTWSGLSALASCLRKKIWIDQDQFVWTPGLYIIFVGPPGVITKSTTTDLSSALLRQVPGIKFGPNNITWQALATSFAAAGESFEWPENSGDWHPMSPVTLVSRELGSLLNPKDGDLVNLFIELYDGARMYEKVTKMSGNDTVEAPWINLMGATTPAWIAENVPRSALGGGLISRCIFLYGDEKENMVPYPREVLRGREVEHAAVREALIHDLEHIATKLTGAMTMTPEAIKWGSKWYIDLWTGAKEHYNDDKIMGYLARKQTHLHKVAMLLACSTRDDLMLTEEDLQLAEVLLCDVELSLDKVFSQIGKTDLSVQAEKFISIVKQKGMVRYEDAYKLVHMFFPDHRDFEGVLAGAIRSGQLVMDAKADGMWLRPPKGTPVLSPNNPNVDTTSETPNS